MAVITEDLIATAGADTDIAGRTLTGGGTWATKLNTSTQVTSITNATPDYFVGSANSTSLYKTSVSAPNLNDEVILETEWTNFGQASTGPMLGISGTLAGSDREWYGFYVGSASPYDYFINKYNQAGGIDLNVGVTQAAAGVSLTTGVTYEQDIRRIDNGDGTVTIKGYIDGVEVISYTDDGVTDGAILSAGVGGMRNRIGARSYSFVHQTWGGNTIISPGSGSLDFTGHTPAIAQPRTIAPLKGSLAFTGYAPVIAQPKVLAPAKGSLTLTGYAPGITQDANQVIAPLSGALRFVGYAPSIAQTGAQIIAPLSGSLVFTGYGPTITQGGQIIVPPHNIVSIAATDGIAVARPTLRSIANVSSSRNTVAVAYRPRGGTSWP